jgi:hypothetical protein
MQRGFMAGGPRDNLPSPFVCESRDGAQERDIENTSVLGEGKIFAAWGWGSAAYPKREADVVRQSRRR